MDKDEINSPVQACKLLNYKFRSVLAAEFSPEIITE